MGGNKLKRAIKPRFLRFYRKPAAFEAIEPDITAPRSIVSALLLDQGAVACPKRHYELKLSAEKVGYHRHNET
jgi:hypothetical protein